MSALITFCCTTDKPSHHYLSSANNLLFRYQGWFLAISAQPLSFYVYIIKPKILSGDESNFGLAPSPKHIYEGFIRKFISEEKFFFWERRAPFFQIRARNKSKTHFISPSTFCLWYAVCFVKRYAGKWGHCGKRMNIQYGFLFLMQEMTSLR